MVSLLTVSSKIFRPKASRSDSILAVLRPVAPTRPPARPLSYSSQLTARALPIPTTRAAQSRANPFVAHLRTLRTSPKLSMASITTRKADQPTLFIDGQWRFSSDGRSRPSINPWDGSIITHVSEASPSDASLAISSSSHFFKTSSFAHLTFSERAGLLSKIADLLQRDKKRLSEIETKDTGKTLAESETDVDDVTNVFRFYAEEAPKLDIPRRITGHDVPDSVESITVKDPVGVCVLIAPWNYPLLQICWKLAPALAAGNACIIKPSEVTPLVTIELVKLMLEAGVPPKALQLLTAGGESVGPTLTESEDVDLVSFTGGLNTGRSILKSAAGTVKRTCVELGGKNPQVVFADTPLDRAIDTVLTSVFLHSGQVCTSATRLIVEESIADAVVSGVVERASQIRLGNGLDPSSETGPLVSAAHLAKMDQYIAMGKKDGAVLRCGGSKPDRNDERYRHLHKDGFFFLPTVFDKCHRDMQIVQAETFGPILTVERFANGDEERAIFLANDTKYGLGGGVQSGDAAKASRVARRLRHGTVWTNTYGAYTPRAEWGGFGMSGNGRELGLAGIEEYVETKHMYTETNPALMGWFKGLPQSEPNKAKL
ncbi:putative aldehyde dehydrogenase [Ceraceosorus guamensis]|uniref:Putative aldehyde dehydrogenase n=1 Tax=Ceraceosorus guamensis TaxID=1522189 RepID=A0A316WB89_9BASI|nr:putative aldehyde dehydrogenase [Ceraceosorus guamensis]PWN45203.1 putative aldehyde dehydrogenase [Ceraceosorus guamensis]